MTYALIEVSQDDGSPVQLFEFKYSMSTWRWTSADRPVVHMGFSYEPMPGLKMPPFDKASDATRSNVQIQTPKGNAVAELFRVQPPSEVVTVTVYDKHYGDPDNEFAVSWKGRILNAEWIEPYTFLTSENVFSSLLRTGMGPRYSRNCRVPLYSPQCGVSRAAFKQTGMVTAVSGAVVTIDSLAGAGVNYFNGGKLTWIDPAKGNILQLMITSYDNATGAFTLVSVPYGLGAGLSADAYPGCDHSLGTCLAKFTNVANYRGEPHIPGKVPFNGTTLF